MGVTSQVFPYVVPCPFIRQLRHSGRTASNINEERKARMSRFTRAKAAAGLLTLAAALGAILAIATAFRGDSNREGEAYFPGVH